MARLPIPGGDDGTWGNVLNNYLSQQHNADGSHDLNLADLNDVAPGTPADGEALVYQSGTWAPAPVSGGGSSTDLSSSSDATSIAIASSTGNDTTISAATTTDAGVMSAADKTKLNGITSGATVNQTDAYLLSRTNHTGTQAISTITNLQTELNNKADSSHTHALNTLSDVDTSGVGTGDVLKYDGTNWIADTDNTGSSDPAMGGDLSGTASNAQIVANAVDTPELANGAVTTAKITDVNVTAAKLATDSVTTIKIADNNVTDAKIASGVAQSKITNLVSDLAAKADESITVSGGTSLAGGGDLTANRTLTLVNDSATPGNTRYYGTDGAGAKGYHTLPAQDPSMGGDLSGTASNAQIVANAVDTTELANNAVTTAKILDSNVTDAKIATGVAQSKITNLVSDLAAKVDDSEKGANNGVATLDGSGLVPLSQIPPLARQKLLPYSYTGNLGVQAGTFRLYNDSGSSWTIDSVRASVGTAPTGASVIIDVNINGTTIFTTQGNRPTITASNNTSGIVTNMNVTTVTNGQYLTVDIDQIGSTLPGADLSVQVHVS